MQGKLHPEMIKAAVRMRGSSFAELAREHNINKALISTALYRPSKCGEIIIAQFLNIPLHELWPERWTPTGERIRPRYAYKYKCNTRAA